MPEQTSQLLKQYALGIKRIYGKNLKAVILYGSYARNDYDEDSDQDIMILVDLTDEQIRATREQVSEYTYDFNMQYDLEIMPVVKSEEHFNYWRAAYPFYKNVNQEGVKIYES